MEDLFEILQNVEESFVLSANFVIAVDISGRNLISIGVIEILCDFK